MPHSKIESARRIAAAIRKVEVSIDQALIDASELAGMLPAERLKSEVGSECGNGAIQAAVDSSALLAQARTRMVHAHQALAETSDALGLNPVAYGGLYGKPRPSASLRAVETNQAA